MSTQNKLKQEVANYLGISSGWLNKYTIVTALFIVWVAFFDHHNIFAYQKLKGTINKLESEKKQLDNDISQALNDKIDLESNYEKFAREKKLMHKPDEEIILIDK
ncbi:MAG: hypothetical protein KDC04_05335 [Saprospiraceae bacterium]|nr:hypothetical protein [Saprospiraceae bacterium]